MPAEAVFPLASAAEAALKELDDPRLSELHDIDSVPVPFVDAEVKVMWLCKEDIDLECPESIEQLIAQVKGLPGLFHPLLN